MRALLTCLLPPWLLACSEYDLTKKEPLEVIEGDTGGDTAIDTAPPPPDCAVELAPAGTTGILAECEAPPVSVSDPWNVAIEWQWLGASEDAEVALVTAMPAVGNLTDDDGDGLVTESDTPDVAFIAFEYDDLADLDFSNARLVVLDGETGEEHWTREGFYGFAGVAIADVVVDGAPEVLAVDYENRVVAVSGMGDVLWQSTAVIDRPPLPDPYQTTMADYPQVTVADLWQDGSPEVLANHLVLDGESGSLVTTLPRKDAILYTMAAVGDLDLDGTAEVIHGDTCYTPGGAAKWTAPIQGSYGHWSVILDVDDDPQGEVVMIGGGQLGVYDSDGAEIRRVSAGSEQPGPPCAADFDGDGEAEIGWAARDEFHLYELDGTKRWTLPIDDSSGLAACSGYDVDGDGAYEILYADEQRLYIIDGTTGTVHFSQSGHSSATVFEYPVVADVDGDSSAEILFASNAFDGSGWSGVTMMGHPEQAWAVSGPTWAVHDFAVTNIDPDGSVPAAPEPPWQAYNFYRARPAMDEIGIDLVATITDVCAASCEPDGTVRVAVQVANQGLSPARAGLPVTLFRKDGASLTPVALGYTTARVASGEVLPGMEFVITAANIGVDGLEARADDYGAGFGAIDECEEWNNGGAWQEAICP